MILGGAGLAASMKTDCSCRQFLRRWFVWFFIYLVTLADISSALKSDNSD